MKLRNACRIVSVVTLGVPLLIGTARAGDQYMQTVIPAPTVGNVNDPTVVNSSTFRIKYPAGGKLAIKPATVPGDGMKTQLILKNVSCDSGATFKCGAKGTSTNKFANAVPAVLDLSVHQVMTPSLGLDMLHVAGVPIQFVQGAATFVASGTNTVTGPQVFPGLITQTLGMPMGIGAVSLRTAGTHPEDCVSAPPAAASCTGRPAGCPIGCLDGIEFGFAGIFVGL